MHESPAIIQLLAENLSIILSHVYSSPTVATALDKQLEGEWPTLKADLIQIAERNADRALLELATHLRILDDRERINEHHRGAESAALGFVNKADGSSEPLFLRDATNKILHANNFTWDLSDPFVPKVCAFGLDASRWVSAEVHIIALTAYIVALPSIIGERNTDAT